jgi:hypothetical protein
LFWIFQQRSLLQLTSSRRESSPRWYRSMALNIEAPANKKDLHLPLGPGGDLEHFHGAGPSR